MAATWTAPKTWAVDTVLPAADLNTYVRDNTEALASPPQGFAAGLADYGNASNSLYTTTSTSFVPLHATDTEVNIAPLGTILIAHLQGFLTTTASQVVLDLQIDGVPLGDASFGSLRVQTSPEERINNSWLITGLTPGVSVEVKVVWRVISSATATFSSSFSTNKKNVGIFYVISP